MLTGSEKTEGSDHIPKRPYRRRVKVSFGVPYSSYEYLRAERWFTEKHCV